MGYLPTRTRLTAYLRPEASWRRLACLGVLVSRGRILVAFSCCETGHAARRLSVLNVHETLSIKSNICSKNSPVPTKVGRLLWIIRAMIVSKFCEIEAIHGGEAR